MKERDVGKNVIPLHNSKHGNQFIPLVLLRIAVLLKGVLFRKNSADVG